MRKRVLNIECLVCGNLITIHQLQQIFSFEQPKICSECSSLMIERKDNGFPIRLYEDNLFMRDLVQRIQQGDFILQELMMETFHQVISKFESDIQEILPLETQLDGKYPPNMILVERLKQRYGYKMTGLKTLIITDELPHLLEIENQMIISIL